VRWFWYHRDTLNCSLNQFYKSIKQTKQGTHKMLNQFLKQEEELIYLKQLVQDVRKDHPTLSCRAMYYLINPVTMGRDKFEAMCKELGFVIERKKSGHRTTDSTGVIRFDNLLKDSLLTGVNQAWSSDITYYQIGDSFYYITFIIDCYSRIILGVSVSGRLTTAQTTLVALKIALKKRDYQIPEGIIFHSDGGGQYYCGDFLKLTSQYKFQNSMCEFSYDNGMVERLNGVIKNNYLKHLNIKSLTELTKEVDRIATLYNNERPHKSLKYKSPNQFEKEVISLQNQQR
jgi:putative transposase